MREILFRGKAFSGVWEYGVPVFCGVNNELAFMKQMHSYDHQVIPETVGQFIGLTDKNGKKVFEGDIVEIKDFSHGCALNYKQPTSRWVVKWYAETAKFGIDYMQLFPYDFKKSEVIGNIHDNPDLLEVSK